MKPTDTTSINSGICCKMPFFPCIQCLITADLKQRAKPGVLKNCLACLWVQAKHTTQAARIQYASVAKRKKYFEVFCLSLTGSLRFSECQRVKVITYWALGRRNQYLKCFANKVIRAKPRIPCGLRQYFHKIIPILPSFPLLLTMLSSFSFKSG